MERPAQKFSRGHWLRTSDNEVMMSQFQRDVGDVVSRSTFRDLDISELATVVWSARHSVFQVETLDSYGVAHEDAVYRAFCEKREPSEGDLEGYRFWFDKVSDAISRLVDVGRVHVLPDRLNDYLEYEIEYGYRKWCLPRGEKVFTLKRSDFPELAQAAFRDFYVIDEMRILFPVYATGNKFVGLQELVTPDSIRLLIEVKDQLRKWATPLLAEGPLPLGRY